MECAGLCVSDVLFFVHFAKQVLTGGPKAVMSNLTSSHRKSHFHVACELRRQHVTLSLMGINSVSVSVEAYRLLHDSTELASVSSAPIHYSGIYFEIGTLPIKSPKTDL